MNTFRGAFFYFIIYFTVVPYGIFGPTVCRLLPFKVRFPMLVSWNRLVIFLLRVICGVKVNIQGKENIPDKPCVVLSNHDSTLETIVLQTLFNPLCTVLKRELLRIPFFGWALAALLPIAIDRASPREAIRQLSGKGIYRITEKQHSLLVFPEGTRNPTNKPNKWARGGATIAIESGAAILPVAHNCGDYWPYDAIAKKPGTITFVIGKPIPSQNRDSKSLTEEAQNWVAEQRALMN
ncbi:MAG: 1-acyl-sn-glycerol-3-phosphate acyltransferase [Cellvibrionaceae bacterium]